MHKTNDTRDNPHIYLAGPIKEVEDNGRRWRDSLANNPDSLFNYLDPLDYADVGDPTEVDVTDIELVETDLALIEFADGMLVNYRGETNTWGTPMEMVYAARTNEIPIAVAWQADTRVSPWVQTHADFIVGRVDECRAYLESQFYEDQDSPGTHGVGVDMWSPAPLTDRLPNVPNTDGDTEDEPMCGVNHRTAQVGDDGMGRSGNELSQQALESVAKMVGSEKDSHGDAVENQEAIAKFWTAYLRMCGHLDLSEEITGGDVAMLMALLNAARNACGDTEADHFRDVAGYAGIGLACEHLRGNADELTVNDLEAHE
jgi:nucleoside 2-deoxyribosyltransferase